MNKIVLFLIISSSYIHACEKISLSNFPLTYSMINNSKSEKQKAYIQQYITNISNATVLTDTIVDQHTKDYVILSIYLFIQAHNNTSICIEEKEKFLDESAQALTQSFGWLRKPTLCQPDYSSKTFFATIENALWWKQQLEKIPFAITIINYVTQNIKQVSSLFHYFSAQ